MRRPTLTLSGLCLLAATASADILHVNSVRTHNLRGSDHDPVVVRVRVGAGQ